MAGHGLVTTNHPLAANVGLRVLEDGGTAADAAVATVAMLNVVEPHMTGIGGDAFALTYIDGEYRALNGSGVTPSAAIPARYRDALNAEPTDDHEIPDTGGLPVTVPGAAQAWYELIDQYGRRPFSDLLQPAIENARRGVPLTENVAREWSRQQVRIQRPRRGPRARVLLREGQALGRRPDDHHYGGRNANR